MFGQASKSRIVPAPLLVVAALAAGAVVHHFFPVGFLPDLGAARLVIASVLCLGSLAIGISGVREFHRHNTPTNPFEQTAALVTSGIFRQTRNPMYLGLVLLVCGVAVALDSVAFLLAAALLVLLLRVLVIAQEERWMSEAFGAAFESYCRSTRRWL